MRFDGKVGGGIDASALSVTNRTTASFFIELMHKLQDDAVTQHVPLAVRWARLRAAYRMANLATHHVLGFTVKLVALVYFLFGLTFLALRYVVLPHIDYYKDNIERVASSALGNEVKIARVYASWSGLRPNLFLGDVTVRDKQARQLLHLPSVAATLSWWSVLGEVRFESLEVIRPDLDIRRAADGAVYVAGIRLGQAKGDAHGPDWALQQRQIVIREGRLLWTDQLRGAPELALENVNLVLINRWNSHNFAFQATPPTALGAPVDVRADFVHPRFGARASDVMQWKGELYADVRDTDLAGWKAYVDYPFELTQGKGSVRAWLTLDHAKLAGFTADVGLNEVHARLGKQLPPLDLQNVSGRLSAHEELKGGAPEGTPTFGTRGHVITLTDFSLTTRDGLTLPPTSMTEIYTAAKGKTPEQTEVRAKLLDLETLAALAAQLPLNPAQRQMLADFAPRGRLRDFSAILQGSYPAISSYRIKGQVDGLGLKAQAPRLAQPAHGKVPAQVASPAIPGFQNLTGAIDATEKGGSFTLNSTGLVLMMPSYFDDPDMTFDSFDMAAHWSFAEKDQFLFAIDTLKFAIGELKASVSGSHLMPIAGQRGKPLGTVDMNATVTGFDVKHLGRYLPSRTPPELRQWLTMGIEEGKLQDATVRLRGDLSQFPFRNDPSKGEFRVFGKIENGKLNYTPGHYAKDGKAPLWPQAENIMGTILFDRARMEIKGNTGRTLGVPLNNVTAVVPDLLDHDMLLEIDGSAAGNMQDFLSYVTASPVLDWIGRFTEDTRATGSAKLALKLHLPLARLLDAKVNGTLQLANNDIVLLPDLPPVQGALGKIEFSERGVNLNGTVGTFLGGPLTVSGGTQRDNAIVVKLAGTATAEGVHRTWPAPAMQRVADRISGNARYTGTVTFKDKQLQVAVESSLAGLGLSFPAPLSKAPGDNLPVHVLLTGNPVGEPGVPAHDDIRIGLGNAIAVHYARQKLARQPWRLLHGGIGVNLPAPEPDSGLMLNVNLNSVNVDQWTSLGAAIAGEAHEPGQDPVRVDNEGPDLTQYVVPDVIAARANELIIGERRLDHVVVGVSRQKSMWQASIDSTQASGHISWNEAGQGPSKVTARLASLIIPESAAADVKDLLEGGKSNATALPALDVVAERFELFNKQLGRLELMASNTPMPVGREWHIDKLSLVNPDGSLQGTGKWVTRGGKSSTSMNVVLDIANAGKLLDRFGFPETIRGGKGKLSGDIAWDGVPYSLDIPSLSGNIAMDVDKGQFLKQDPGAAKLLGVLSLQALPRLLKLDFHDVFSEGLAFDSITADAVITHGVLRTENLKMQGVAATVLMDGSADIANETANLHVVVIPEFNLGTGPLVYMLAVNPVVGLGSFLAQWFLRAPVMKALTYQMQIAGPWKSPTVTKLDNGKLVPVPLKPSKKE